MGRRREKRQQALGSYWRVPTPWHLLNSMSFAIGILTVLVIVSAVGVIVPEGAPEAAYLSKYGAVFGRLIVLLGFDHLFRAGWYVALWAVVVASLIVCSFNRLPSSVRAAFGKPLLKNPADYKTYALNAHFKVRIPAQRVLFEAKSVLRRKRFKIHEGSCEQMSRFLAYKGGLERLGPFVTHMSIVVVLVGGMLASLAGSNHNQPVRDGEAFEVPDLSHRTSVAFHMNRLLGRTSGQDFVRDEMGFMDWRRLPEIPEKKTLFKVRVDSFRIETTEDGRVADYKTTATVFDPDSVLSAVIEVNKPLIYKGYSFYQSSYNYSSREVKRVHLLVTDKSGNPVGGQFDLPFMAPVEIPGTPLTVTAKDFVADFVYDLRTKTVSSRSDEHRNPAVLIEVARRDEEPFEQWLMLRGGMAHSSKDDDYDFRVTSYDPEMYTVLEVRTHPIMNVIWTGFGMGVIGVFLSFYVTRRRVWVGAADGGDGSAQVFLAAATHRYRESFKREFKDIVSDIRGRAGPAMDSATGDHKGKRRKGK